LWSFNTWRLQALFSEGIYEIYSFYWSGLVTFAGDGQEFARVFSIQQREELIEEQARNDSEAKHLTAI